MHKREGTMFANMDPVTEELFYWLSAEKEHWYEMKPPSLNPFMKNLMSDDDAIRALNMINSKTDNWNGKISSKQLIQFLSVGYRAVDVNRKPSGFTAFMCHPWMKPDEIETKLIEKATIKSMFSEDNGKLDEETLEYFSQDDFFLPKTYDEVTAQLKTTIKLLRLFTNRSSIAVSGYEHGLHL